MKYLEGAGRRQLLSQIRRSLAELRRSDIIQLRSVRSLKETEHSQVCLNGRLPHLASIGPLLKSTIVRDTFSPKKWPPKST